MNEAQEPKIEAPKPFKVSLSISTKGVHTWEVRAYADTMDDAIEAVKHADANLSELYGKPGE